MRIFLSCQQSGRRHPVPAYAFWEVYFKRGLEEVGHECLEAEGVDWAEGLACLDEADRSAWRRVIWPRVIDRVRDLHRQKSIELFLSYLFPGQVESAAISEIRSLGIPCVNFFCDNVRDFTRPPACFANFDLHWVPEFKALRMYRRAGLPFVHAPMPMWVDPERRTWDNTEKYGVSFIGSRDSLRERLFADVLRLGQPVELRGDGWDKLQAAPVFRRRPFLRRIREQLATIGEQGATAWVRKVAGRWRPRVPDSTFDDVVRPRPDAAGYISVTQQSRITLGVNRYPSFRYPFNRPDTYSRLRDLEAPMLGACYLTEWTEGLDQMYDLGTEIETYRDAEELVAKVRMLETDPARRRSLRRLGQARTLAKHTVGASLACIGQRLGLGL